LGDYHGEKGTIETGNITQIKTMLDTFFAPKHKDKE